MIWSSLKKIMPFPAGKPVDISTIPRSISKIVCLSHILILEDFSRRGRDVVRSATFGPTDNDQIRFRIAVYPHGEDNDHQRYVSMYLEMLPNEIDQVNTFIKLEIVGANDRKYSGGNTFLHTFVRGGPAWGYSQFIKRTTLLDPLKFWLVDNKFTVNCEVQIVPAQSTINTELSLTTSKCATYEEWFGDDQLADVCFVLNDTEVLANKFILAAGSRTFSNMFENNNDDDDKIVIEGVKSEVFKELLKYLYTGKVSSIDTYATELLSLASEYQVDSLKAQCEQYLCAQLSLDSALDYLALAEAYDAPKLKAKTLDFIRSKILSALAKDSDLMSEAFNDLMVKRHIESSWWQKVLWKRKSRTHTKVTNFNHLWTIENFSSLCDNTFNKRTPVIYSCNFGANPGELPQFHLKMHARGATTGSQRFVSLYLNMATSKNEKETILYRFSIIDAKGRKRNTRGNSFLLSKTFERGLSLGRTFFILQSKTKKLLRNKSLTILCEVQVKQNKTKSSSKSDKRTTTSKTNKSECKPAANWLASEKLSDVVLVIGGDTEVRAHKAALAQRSPVFATMFKCKQWKEAAENRVEIADDKEVFQKLLMYFYTGKVPSLDRFARQLLPLADKYQVDCLKELCEKQLASDLSLNTAMELLHLAKLHDADHLKSKVIEFIEKPTLNAIKATADQKLLIETFQNLVLHK